MSNLNKTILINGKVSKLFYDNSKSEKKDRANIYTVDMLTVVTELLKGHISDFKYQDGVTTLNAITSWDEPQLGIKRLANKISELRKILSHSILLTYRPLNEKEWMYAVIKSDENIKFLENLKTKILFRLEEDGNYSSLRTVV